MNEMKDKLEALVKKHGFIAAVVADVNGELLARFGDPQAPSWNDPYNTFFRDRDAIVQTFDFLASEPAPQSFAQGTREIVLLQPRPDLVLGLLKDDGRGAVEMYRLTQQLAEEATALFST